MSLQRYKITIEGIVQGVGFRPFVYQLAKRYGLVGTVCNDTRGVIIEIEGERDILDKFVVSVRKEKPPLAVIQSVAIMRLPAQGASGFSILPSARDEAVTAQIAPDTFVCNDCLAELFDPLDRRYHYPFINCTNCGPRYTIITDIPYDRSMTTMADFPLCAACQAEYDDPATRRFHAQPNACPVCGPQLQLESANGKTVATKDPVLAAVLLLKAGNVLALKGLGGYHLAVDATNAVAVKELRRRKQRDEKPFALMAKNLEAVASLCDVGADEARLLQGPERPIVLLRKKDGHGLAEEIAPANLYFGMMLPYTPLHHLLLDNFTALVMTSANLSDEPIAFRDDDARQRLAGIADAFLTHNRRIHTRTDDSIARVMAGRPLLLRRARGFVPRSVALPAQNRLVLAVGAELKNTICLTRQNQAFLSQHIGDLKNLEVYDSFKNTVDHMRSILAINPERIAHDLHPDYYSTRYALEESGLPALAVQHHHAHLASCLAEHGSSDPAIGVIFDGIGYGADGHIWGGEFLVGDLSSYERVGHLRYQPMPGGDLATSEPWRMALSYLTELYGEVPAEFTAFNGVAANELRLVTQAIEKRINTPLTSSCGRLFDAVAAIVGVRQKVSYEGQAAMELEMLADPLQSDAYPYLLNVEHGQIVFDPLPMIEAVLKDHAIGMSAARVSGKFHWTLAVMIAEVCSEIRQQTGLERVVLSGGVFQNSLLTKMAIARLENSAFQVLTHSLVPPNDGGLALGQAAVAANRAD